MMLSSSDTPNISQSKAESTAVPEFDFEAGRSHLVFYLKYGYKYSATWKKIALEIQEELKTLDDSAIELETIKRVIKYIDEQAYITDFIKSHFNESAAMLLVNLGIDFSRPDYLYPLIIEKSAKADKLLKKLFTEHKYTVNILHLADFALRSTHNKEQDYYNRAAFIVSYVHKLVSLGANPAMFDKNLVFAAMRALTKEPKPDYVMMLLFAKTKEQVSEEVLRKHRAKNMLIASARNSATPLGSVLHPPAIDLTRAFSIKEECQKRKACVEKINKLLDMQMGNIPLEALIKNRTFNWSQVNKLVALGANAGLTVQSYGLMHAIIQLTKKKERLPASMLIELFECGLDPDAALPGGNETIIQVLAMARHYIYADIYLLYGANCRFIDPTDNCEKTILDKLVQDINKEEREAKIAKLLKHMPRFLNLQVPFMTEKTAGCALIADWLSQADPEEVTPNIRAHIKRCEYKKPILDAIINMPDAVASLEALRKIVKDPTSALGMVFREGHTDESRGNFGDAVKEYARRAQPVAAAVSSSSFFQFFGISTPAETVSQPPPKPANELVRTFSLSGLWKKVTGKEPEDVLANLGVQAEANEGSAFNAFDI